MKKFILSMFILVLLVGTVSAFEIDNVKRYDTETKTITVVNAFGLGDDIAQVKLLTPLINQVGYGAYVKVAEFEVTAYDIYTNAFKELELFDKNNLDRKFTRDYDYKVLTQEEIIVEEIKYNAKNQSEVVGTHIVLKDKWINFNEGNFAKDEILTIGLFTYVEKDDRVEWIPNLFGIRINEWAVWTASLNADLVFYFTLNGTTGTVVDSTGNTSGINNGATRGIAGLQNFSFDFEQTEADSIDLQNNITDFQLFQPFTVRALVKPESTGSRYILAHNGATEQWAFFLFGGTSTIGLTVGGDVDKCIRGVSGVPTGEWSQVVVVVGASTCQAWINATSDFNDTRESIPDGSDTNGTIGSNENIGTQEWDGLLDEVALWNRELSGQEIVDLNNAGGLPLTFQPVLSSPTINVFSPTNTTFTTSTIFFNATTDKTITEFIVNYNGTNITGFTINTTLEVEDGFHHLFLYANGTELPTEWGLNDSVFFTVDTTPTIVAFSPTNETHTSSTLYFNATNTTQSIDVWIINYNGTNITLSDINTTLTTIEDGTDFNLKIYANNSETGVFAINDSIFFSVDATAPLVSITFPNETFNYHKINTNLFVNWSVSDTSLDTCTLEYDGINTTVTCLDNQTTINITSVVNKSVTLYVNDTIGNSNSSSVTWDYRLFQNNEFFTSSLLEGTSSVFSINFTTNGTDITIGNLSYNDTTNIGSIVQSGNTFEINKTIIAPSTSAEVNLLFFWNITQADSIFFALDPQNQTVLNLVIGDCSVDTNVLYNFTNVDEETQALINADNVTSQVDLLIFNVPRTIQIANFSKEYTSTNPFAICFNATMSSGESYVADLQVKYFGDEHEREFYHIQNSTITTDDFPTNITLYDLANSSSQSFEITFKDASFLPVENALIQIQRKYISEGLFRIVEIPKTDTEGKTLGHFVLNDIVYTLVVIKNGETLGTFNNVRVVCQNPNLEDCTIPLNAVTTTIQPEDFTVLDDFTFTLDYNKTSREVESIFTIPSSTVGTVLLNVTLNDALGNTTVCSDTVTSAGGTLTCVVPFSFGNTSVVVQLIKDEVVQGSGIIFLASKPSDTFGANLVFIGIFLYMTLIGLAISSSPMITGFFLILGAILGVSLNLVSGFGFIGAGATILWLIIAIIITLIKGQSRS